MASLPIKYYDTPCHSRDICAVHSGALHFCMLLGHPHSILDTTNMFPLLPSCSLFFSLRSIRQMSAPIIWFLLHYAPDVDPTLVQKANGWGKLARSLMASFSWGLTDNQRQLTRRINPRHGFMDCQEVTMTIPINYMDWHGLTETVKKNKLKFHW